jgi:hypothetical protein
MASSKFCPNCSAELQAGELAASCWNCGAIFNANSAWKPLDNPPGTFRAFSSKNETSASGSDPTEALDLSPDQLSARRGYLVGILLILGVGWVVSYLAAVLSVNSHVILIFALTNIACTSFALRLGLKAKPNWKGAFACAIVPVPLSIALSALVFSLS